MEIKETKNIEYVSLLLSRVKNDLLKHRETENLHELNNFIDKLISIREIIHREKLSGTKFHIDANLSYYDSIEKDVFISANGEELQQHYDERFESYLKRLEKYNAWYKKNEKDILLELEKREKEKAINDKKTKAKEIANLKKQIKENQKLLDKLENEKNSNS